MTTEIGKKRRPGAITICNILVWDILLIFWECSLQLCPMCSCYFNLEIRIYFVSYHLSKCISVSLMSTKHFEMTFRVLISILLKKYARTTCVCQRKPNLAVRGKSEVSYVRCAFGQEECCILQIGKREEQVFVFTRFR